MKRAVLISRRDWWAPVVGLSAVATYVGLTTAAVVLYPGNVTPADVYLSDLGNADYSPGGYVLFAVAMILAGLLSIPFFIGLSRSFAEGCSRRLARTALGAGLVNGVAVIMAGAIAEHVHLGVHIGWALLIFASFLPLLVAHGLMFWGLGTLMRAVGAYGLAVCLVDLGLLAALLARGPEPGVGSVMEWVAVFAYLGWVALASVGMAVRSFSLRKARS